MFAICLVFIRHGVYPQFYNIATYIWMGKTLANRSGFTKFAKVFPATVLCYMVASSLRVSLLFIAFPTPLFKF